MTGLLLAQLLVPVLLVGWMAIRPLRSAVGLTVQALGSGLVLLGSLHAGLWLFPPWWLPSLALAALGAAVAWQVCCRRWRTRRPSGPAGWAGTLFFAALGVVGAGVVVQTQLATRPPDGPDPVRLGFPLAEGSYLVVNGGASELLNAHRASARPDAPERMRRYRGNGWAVDVVAIDALGMRADGLLPSEPSAYRIFGAPVVAPCAGEVLRSVDGLPDLEVPLRGADPIEGNHVLLGCADAQVLLAHLRRGSVRVGEGERVEEGDTLAEVGNSGASDEPHLHVHAQRPGPPDAPLGGDPLPMRLDGRWLVRGDRVRVE